MDLSKLMFFSELLNVFVIVADMVLLKLLLGFVKVVLLISRQTKPSRSLKMISKLVQASALN